MLKAAKVKLFSSAKSTVAAIDVERVVVVAERERGPGLHAVIAQDAHLLLVAGEARNVRRLARLAQALAR